MALDTTDPNWSLYPYYTPSKPLPIVFAALILLLGLALSLQSYTRPRWPHFGFIVTWASLVWLTGFAVRAASAWTPSLRQNIPLYIAQYVLVLMGPPLYAAAEWFILGRLMAYLPFHAPLHPGRVLSSFLLLSAAVEGLTAGGAALAASAGASPAARGTGLACVCAALILQALLELAFIALVALMHARASRSGHATPRVRMLTGTLYATSALMLVRCIVRAIESFEARACASDTSSRCSGGSNNTIASREWIFWVFEVGCVALYALILAALHPRRFLPSDYRVFLDARDCVTERVGPGFSSGADGRAVWVTVLDPMDFVGALRGKGRRVVPFWEESWPAVSGARGRVGGRRDVEAVGKEKVGGAASDVS